MVSQDDQDTAAAAHRIAEQLELLTAAIQTAAETIADAIRQRPGTHEDMSAQGSVS